MKPSLQFSVPCMNIADHGDKPQSFESIFFELPVPEIPFELDQFFIANGWCSGKGRYSSVMKILKPDGSTLVNTGEQLVELESQTKPFMIVNKIRGVELDVVGTYKIQVFLDNEMVLEYPLVVRKVEGHKPATTK